MSVAVSTCSGQYDPAKRGNTDLVAQVMCLPFAESSKVSLGESSENSSELNGILDF